MCFPNQIRILLYVDLIMHLRELVLHCVGRSRVLLLGRRRRRGRRGRHLLRREPCVLLLLLHRWRLRSWGRRGLGLRRRLHAREARLRDPFTPFLEKFF